MRDTNYIHQKVSISPESSDHDASKAPSKAPASALVEKHSEENTDAPPISKNKTRKTKKRKEVETAEPAEEAIGETQETESKPSAKDNTAPASFESYYLRMATSEFAEDLDKVRTASDFRDASLPILVKALQQGASIFSMEEKRDIPSFKLFESERVFAFLDIQPLSKGHAMVIPKHHGAKLTDIPDDSLTEILPVVKKLAFATGAENYNILQNNGRLAHQVVDHVHFHMIPKPNQQEGLGINWPAEKADMDTLKQLFDEIKAKM
ncbi:MAG: Adenosine 5'-monophosphoramidase [Candelina submexicana]|nr:MAG: Adenosine 5'-monophosphoramidase [Candelina submexicana]